MLEKTKTQLIEGEELVHETVRHWRYLFNPLPLLFLLFALYINSIVISYATGLKLISVPLVLLSIIPIYVRLKAFNNDKITATNKRVFIRSYGWFGLKHQKFDVRNIYVKQSFLGKILNYKTFTIIIGDEKKVYKVMKPLKDFAKSEKKSSESSFSQINEKDIDFIAIDFETANKNRISACAIGVSVVVDSEIVFSKRIFIKPPQDEEFSRMNISIHGITSKHVEHALNFKEVWKNELKQLFNNNLVVFHNASMDLSVLKQLFLLYNIEDYNFKTIDTMQMAGSLSLPKKIRELAGCFSIEFKNVHDPVEDAQVCAKVFIELRKTIGFSAFEKQLKFKDKYTEIHARTLKEEKASEENKDYLKLYKISKSDFLELEIEDKAFLFTGDLEIDRDVAKDFITNAGGVIKSGVSSKVDYVVVGKDFGWAKIQKLHKYNTEKNCNIQIITENQFNKWFY
ncbi:exonuclease domain-containing protein [Tenacibaculum soleae]|uniref:exonuclease domain-containing protein n=1 Tax=Tenacibaculum soleae TaxID=447689 RepID=UPI002300B9E6|nr:exonuclease domain-containing protein [Tenacibaculum soleae]